MRKVSRVFDLVDRYKNEYSTKINALCIKDHGEWICRSSEDYYNLTHLLAYQLYQRGVRKGDRIGIISTNRPEWCLIDMAIGMIGAINVSVYTTLAEDEYAYIFNHAEIKMLFISDNKIHKRVKDIVPESAKDHIFCFTEVEGVPSWKTLFDQQKEPTQDQLDVVNKQKKLITEDDLATIIYTSGTTGKPKGVMLSHKNLVSNFVQHSHNHSLGSSAKIISFLPLCHIYERSILYHFQYKGMAIYFVDNIGKISAMIKEVKPHMFSTVPRLLERIYDGIVKKGNDLKGIQKRIFNWALNLGLKYDFNDKGSRFYRLSLYIANKIVFNKWRAALGGNLEIIISGGAALQPRITRVFGAAKIYALEGYGLSETSPVIAVNNIVTNELMVGTNGPILPGVEVSFAEDGEILCKGPSLMQGYYKEPELTKQVIDKDGWFHTGDIGTLINGIYLKITDRKKEIFKLSGGKYVAPQAIENLLKESTLIQELMVVGDRQKFASALIVPNMEEVHLLLGTTDEDEIAEKKVQQIIQKEVNQYNKRLGQHEQLKRIKVVFDQWSSTTGELSSTLKLKRNVILDKYKDKIEDIFSGQ
ncbi:long-chain fatty acid--CoA ligase [Halosquirtibacter xylanolyticus]|uniref:AMP-dependent synthetase/ligase n=1 Tax=Halosquirtibacter xylanolyticus TaxID=3374599 RepID=UPI00374961CD|nr:long-chain fatty acid--CoA ligase [Prolixibacteraceae bacterium]